MPPKIARRGMVAPFIVMDVMRAANERAAAGGRVLHLEVGQPSTPAPPAVLEAARRALAADRLGYTDALGLPALRQRIARHYTETYDIELDWRRIAVSAGSSGAFVLAFLAAFDVADRVAVTSPGYPAYRNILAALGVEVILLPVDGSSHFQPTPAMLDRIEGPLSGLVIASPANPTGSMLDQATLRDVVTYCADRNVRLISDEIYHGITFGEPAQTAVAFGDAAIVVNSFSKYFSMTGWRLGWTVLPEALLRPLECLAQNLFISAPTLSQHAALSVFDCRDELAANVRRYQENRALLLDALPRARFPRLAPADGAFYVYAQLADTDPDSVALTRDMLAEAEVAATPGVDFDPERGHRFVRFSFAGTTEDIAEAAQRLIAWRS